MIKQLLHAIKIYKKKIKLLCHSYFGYLIFNFTRSLNGYKVERNRIKKVLGYYPNIRNPKSFNEKILWKKIYDRNPLLPIISDKYRVREYIKDILGKEEAEKILVPLLYVTNIPENIPFHLLPDEYIIKPNHASGRLIIAENIEKQKRYKFIKGKEIYIYPDSKKIQNKIINTCRNWLETPYGFYNHEWAYQKIKRKIVIEKLLKDHNKKIPPDYKFSIFSGKCDHFSVWYDRFDDIKRARYTPEWQQIGIKFGTKQLRQIKKPKELQNMIDLAEKLGKPFDYLRVDLYLVEDNIYFGEFTSYPANGKTRFPKSYDLELGSKWKINPKYWKK